MKTSIASGFADLRDIADFHYCYEGTPETSQTALSISVPGKRISIQLDSQIKRVTKQHAEMQLMLLEALPSVEESEQFNKPSCRTLSKRIRELLEANS